MIKLSKIPINTFLNSHKYKTIPPLSKLSKSLVASFGGYCFCFYVTHYLINFSPFGLSVRRKKGTSDKIKIIAEEARPT